MSLNAAMIQAMVDKGLSGQDIADIAKAGEAKVDRTAAERQARYRANKRSGRNAVTSRCDPPIEDNHTPSDLSPNGENHIPNAKPKRPKSKRSSDDGLPLPADWTPKLGPKTQVVVDGWPPGKFDRELRKFTAHAADKGRLSKDWDAALRTWLENADEWMTKNDRTPASPDEPTNVYARAAIDGIARRQAERAGAEFG